MNRTITITALAFIASLVAAPAFAQPSEKSAAKKDRSAEYDAKRDGAKHGPKHRGPGHMFAKLDTNKDGKITKAEAVRVSDDHFARVDKNGDKVISQEEAKAFGEAMRKEHKSPEARAQRFAKMDKNGDGKIERSETKMPERFFVKVDTNNDGALTKAELETAHAKREQAQANKSDKKGDRGARHFAKMDKNGDGKLSQAESRGAATARFAMMDKNGDQVITKAEAREAMKEFRKGHQGKRQAKTTK